MSFFIAPPSRFILNRRTESSAAYPDRRQSGTHYQYRRNDTRLESFVPPEFKYSFRYRLLKRILHPNLTLAVSSFISSSANRLPRHIRVPNPKGSVVYGWCLLSIGCPFIHRSGMNSFARGKYSSSWLVMWCNMSTVVYRKMHNVVTFKNTFEQNFAF